MPVAPPFDPPAIAPNYWTYSTLSFNRSQEFPSNPEFRNVFANDIHVYDANGDGHLDVVTIYSLIPYQAIPGVPIRVLLGDGHGGFTDGTASLISGGVPLHIDATGSVVADFNGDGVNDLFISQEWQSIPQPMGGYNGLLLSNGTGGLTNATAAGLPAVRDFTHWSTGGDIDGDGDIDLYVGNIGSSANTPRGDESSYFLINDSHGIFTRSDTRLPAAIESSDRQYTSCLLFDADNDGDNDLLLGMWGPQAALAGNGATYSVVLYNDGAGQFSETASSRLPAPAFDVNRAEVLGTRAADLTGDGYADLVLLTHNQFSRYIQVLVNNGDGTFNDQTAQRLDAFEALPQDTGRYFHLVDINADGAADMVLQTGGESRFYLNDGTGHFVALPPDFLFTNNGSYAFLPGDFNEDGRVDFFVRTFVNGWDDPANVTEFDWVVLWTQPAGTTLTGDDAANAVLGIEANETLNGLGGDDVIFGGAGNDTANGGDGADHLDGGAGTDTLLGDAGGDTLNGATGDDWMDGGAGDDVFAGGAGGVNTMLGGDGLDSVSFAAFTTALYVDLAGGAYAYSGGGWDALTSIEGVIGGSGADTLLGDGNANRLLGGGGADLLQGRNGNDALGGEAGDDWLDGGAGDDELEGGGGVNILIGGDGLDLASYASATVGLWIDVSAGVYAGAGGVWDVFFQSIEGAIGGSGNDYMIAAASGSTLRGEAGTDTLIGGAGDDHLLGGADSDWIVGGAGNDTLDGGLGVDIYTAGAGADVFALGANAVWDVAFDFNPTEDRFDLAGNLWLGLVEADWDGDGQADDTLLGYAGGNFVALNVSGLTLAQWNALVIAPGMGDGMDEKSPDSLAPETRPDLSGEAGASHSFIAQFWTPATDVVDWATMSA